MNMVLTEDKTYINDRHVLDFALYTSIEPHSQCFYAFKTPIYEGDT